MNLCESLHPNCLTHTLNDPRALSVATHTECAAVEIQG